MGWTTSAKNAARWSGSYGMAKPSTWLNQFQRGCISRRGRAGSLNHWKSKRRPKLLKSMLYGVPATCLNAALDLTLDAAGSSFASQPPPSDSTSSTAAVISVIREVS